MGFLRVFNMVIHIINLQQGNMVSGGAHSAPSHGQFMVEPLQGAHLLSYINVTLIVGHVCQSQGVGTCF